MDAVAERSALQECLRGRPAAFRPIVESYFERVVRLAWALVGDPEDARDLAQESFVAAYRALPQYDPDRAFYPWLRGIVVNRCKAFVRARARARARVEATADRPDHWARPAAIREGESRRTTDLVRRGLVELTEEDRTLLVLKHVEGYTYDELAAALAIPRGTVMSRLYRARQRLRGALQRLDPSLVEARLETRAGSGEEDGR